jgi:hypothetical protein
MRSLKFLLGAALVLGIGYFGATNAADDKKEELTIKKIMQFAHDKETGKLADAKAGTIKDDDKKKLVEGYIALGKLKPPKGEADSWKKFTDAIASAAKDYGDGKDEKAAKLSKAVNCKGCHTAHR